MKVSVIVPTFNGAHKLPNVLQSLLRQTFLDYELIVVVDGSSDETASVLYEWLPQFKNAKSSFQTNSGRSKTRNAGAKIAIGELLIFIDDDMRLEKDCLARHIQHHEKIHQTLVSGAQVYDEKKASTDFQKYKSAISKNWYLDIEQIYPDPLPAEKLHLTAANFSVPKKLFEQLGGFDETVTDMEDFLLAYKATQNKIPVYYLHAAFGWHDDFADIFTMQNRYVQYKQTAIAVATRYPELQKLYPRYSTSSSLFRKTTSGLLSIKPVISMMNNNPLIPVAWRYRLYGAILHAKANLAV